MNVIRSETNCERIDSVDQLTTCKYSNFFFNENPFLLFDDNGMFNFQKAG